MGGGEPLYLFLDPSRTGDGDKDHAVFARDFGRLSYGENRRVVAQLDAAWRPWSRQGKATPSACSVSCSVRGQWRAASFMAMKPVAFDSAVVSTPKAAPKLSMAADDSAPAAVPVLCCQVNGLHI